MFFLKNLKKEDLDHTKDLKFRKEVLDDDAKKVYEQTNPRLEDAILQNSQRWNSARIDFAKKQNASLITRFSDAIRNIFSPKKFEIPASWTKPYILPADHGSYDKFADNLTPEPSLWEKAQKLKKPTPVLFYQKIADRSQYYRWMGMMPERAIYDPKLDKVREMTFLERLRYSGQPTKKQIERHFR